MKKKITESTTSDNILGFLWVVFIWSGSAYLVFWKGESGWWFILTMLLSFASVWHRKEEIED